MFIRELIIDGLQDIQTMHLKFTSPICVLEETEISDVVFNYFSFLKTCCQKDVARAFKNMGGFSKVIHESRDPYHNGIKSEIRCSVEMDGEWIDLNYVLVFKLSQYKKPIVQQETLYLNRDCNVVKLVSTIYDSKIDGFQSKGDCNNFTIKDMSKLTEIENEDEDMILGQIQRIKIIEKFFDELCNIYHFEELNPPWPFALLKENPDASLFFVRATDERVEKYRIVNKIGELFRNSSSKRSVFILTPYFSKSMLTTITDNEKFSIKNTDVQDL